jgi:hypothetical protein
MRTWRLVTRQFFITSTGDIRDERIHFTLIDNQLKIIQVIRVIRLTCSMLRPDRGSPNL